MIVEKVLQIMSALGPIIKDKTNEEKGFEYASLANIISKCREEMIDKKLVIIPLYPEQIAQKGDNVLMTMVYRLYDAEKDKEDKNEYIDVKIPCQGCDREGWAVYKALSGAYKYLLTQTFAIPTLDDAEKDKYINQEQKDDIENENEAVIVGNNLNENSVNEILGNSDITDFGKIFDLGKVG